MDSVTEENVSKLLKEHGDKTAELETVQSQTIQQMWFSELTRLEQEYGKYKEERERIMSGESAPKKKTVKKSKLALVDA
jgi:hypothetical protein